MGYNLKKVRKTKPQSGIDETDVIFKNLAKVREQRKADESKVRLSIDSKDCVKIGTFSRGGKNQVRVEAADHDFSGEYVTHFGIYPPHYSKYNPAERIWGALE